MKKAFIWIITILIMVIPFIAYIYFAAKNAVIRNIDISIVDGIVGTVIFYISVYLALKFNNKFSYGKSFKKS